MIKKALIIIISIFLITACGKSTGSDDAIKLKYIFKKGQVYKTSVTTIVTNPKLEKPTRVRFDFLTKFTEVINNGERAKLVYEFTKLDVNGKVTKPPVQAMELEMTKYGKAIFQIEQMRNFQTTIAFPDKKMKPGDTWNTSLSAPIKLNYFDVKLTAKFTGYKKYKEKDAIFINYQGENNKIEVDKNKYKISIKGKKIFDHKRGIYFYISTVYNFFIKKNGKWEQNNKIEVQTQLHE